MPYHMSLRAISEFWCSRHFLHKKQFPVHSYPQLFCGRVHVSFMLFVFVCIWWRHTRTDYLSNMTDVL